jgi:hypothetical protein
MAQSLEAPPAPVVRVSPSAGDRERDEKAWNLPRQAPIEPVPQTVSHGTDEEGLDWNSFVATRFPGSRRHNFTALVAYSDYKRSLGTSEERGSEATPNAEAPSIEAMSVAEWENEGGASPRLDPPHE